MRRGKGDEEDEKSHIGRDKEDEKGHLHVAHDQADQSEASARLTVRFDLVARDVTCDDRDEAGEAPGTEHACDRKRDADDRPGVHGAVGDRAGIRVMWCGQAGRCLHTGRLLGLN